MTQIDIIDESLELDIIDDTIVVNVVDGINVYDEGTLKGSFKSVDFAGGSVSVTVQGSKAVVTISDSGSGTPAANLVFAGPSAGPAAEATFRALVAADISSIALLTSGTSNLAGNLTIDPIDLYDLTIITDDGLNTAGFVKIGKSGFQLQTSIFGAANGQANILASSNQVNLYSSKTSDGDILVQLRFLGGTDSEQNAMFIDNRAIPIGVQYNGDFRATFTDRSLVDKGFIVNRDAPAVALESGASIDLTGEKHTLTTSLSAITFTNSYTGDGQVIELTLNATSSIFTFPAGYLCMASGTASGDNTLSLSGTSGDKYIILVMKIGSSYYVSSTNMGQ